MNNRFVDVHHHLSYGLDDGAQTFEEMQQMMMLAVMEGVGHIVCTTHATPGRRPFDGHRYMRHLHMGQRWCDAEGLPLRLHPGCEILYTPAAAEWLEDGRIPALGNARTALVEFTPDVTFHGMCEAAEKLGNSGYRMVLAHVERYHPLRKIEHVQSLREDYGVSIQMNTATVTMKNGFFTQMWVRRMLDEGYVDLVASDAHNLVTRPCRMQRCYGMLSMRYGQAYAQALCVDNPMKLIGVE